MLNLKPHICTTRHLLLFLRDNVVTQVLSMPNSLILKTICLLLFASKIGTYNAQLSDSLCKTLPENIKPANRRTISSADKRKIIAYAHEYSWKLTTTFEKELDRLAHELDQESINTKDTRTKVLNNYAISVYYNYFRDRESPKGLWVPYCELVIKYGGNDTAFTKHVASAHLGIGIYRVQQNKYEVAAKKFQKALELYVSIQDTSGISLTYSHFYALYSSMYLFKQAIDAQNAMLRYMTVDEKKNGLAKYYTEENYQDKACTYLLWYEATRKKALMDSAWYYINKTPIVGEDSDRWRSYSFFLKGFSYFLNNDYQKSLNYLDSSLALTEYYFETIPIKIAYRGMSLLKLGRRAEAKKILLNNPEIKFDFNLAEHVYAALYSDALEQKQYKEALQYLDLSKRYKDSAAIMAQRGEVLAVAQKYDLSEKEIRIVNLELENSIKQAEQKTMALAFILTAIVSVVIIITLYSIGRERKMKAIQASAELDKEKRNMEDMLRLQEREIQRVRKKALLNLRRQISRDLHDGLSSSLAGLKYYVNDLRIKANSPQEKELLENIEQEVESVYIQARSYMHNLHTGIEEAVGNLNPFLQNIFQDLSRKNNIDIKLKYDKEEIESKLSLIQQNQLTLMLKEAVSNILKHSGAGKIEIDISFENQICRFYVSDNGKGFTRKPHDRGLGMESIQLRIKRIKGQVAIKSSSSGTRLSGSFPLA